MAGGTFTQQNKKLAGVYVNIASNSVTSTNEGTSGVVTLPVQFSFGESHKVVEVTKDTNLTKLFGNGKEVYDKTSLDSIKNALMGAQKVLAYNLRTGTQATAELYKEDDLTILAVAKYAGSRGNDLKIIIRESLDNEITGVTTYDVLTYLDTTYIDSQTVRYYEELVDNDMVSFVFKKKDPDEVTSNEPEDNAGISFTKGSTNSVDSDDMISYLDEIDKWDFNVMGVDVPAITGSSAGEDLFLNYIKLARDNRGKFVRLVYGNDRILMDVPTEHLNTANYEGVTYIANGVVLSDGTEVNPSKCVAWVAGASASAGVADSLTYTAYPNAVDAYPRLSEEKQIDMINHGKLVFIEKRGTAVILQDINTLTTFTVEKNQDFSKNKIIRILDDFCNNSRAVFEDSYIGKVPNNVEGRELYRSNRISYLQGYLSQGAIENFVSDDVTVSLGETKESVVINLAIQPVDAMEKLYMYIQVQ